jgi:hypothetical protein
MENLEITDREAFGSYLSTPNGEVKKSWSKTVKTEPKYYANEGEIVKKASKAPHHLVCAAFGITPEELNEILSRNNGCNC